MASKEQFDPTGRFGDRVDDYKKYRPGYPPQVAACLREWMEAAGRPLAVADIGAGTGIFSELLARAGFAVTAVEPNAPMRAVAAEALRGFSTAGVQDGRAEATGLATGSVDLVCAAQSYHWFDHDAFVAEVRRICRRPARLALVWNDRVTRGKPFAEAYEAVLNQQCPLYRQVDYKQYNNPDSVRAAFTGWKVRQEQFTISQQFDFEGMAGRLSSSSYSPKPGSAEYPALQTALLSIFDQHQSGGTVLFEYETLVYLLEEDA